MKQTLLPLSFLLALCATLPSQGQAPPSPSTLPASSAVQSRISRWIPGPGDRPQGLLLRNGAYVNLPPGLAAQLPATLSRHAPVRVSGDLLTYAGSRTIQAHNIQIAGVTYSEPPVPVSDNPALRAPLAMPPVPPTPCGAAAPPPPRPAAGGPPPPPPPPLAPRPLSAPPPPSEEAAPPPPPVAPPAPPVR